MLAPVVALLAVLSAGSAQTATYRFPDGFMLGAASSAFQVEGAWNEDGKGESIQDNFYHNHPIMGLNASGDVACDSYHKYKEDVQMLKGINANVYRFSISWPRILPTGDLDVINQPGIDYYNNLINELLANGIQPVVTMYHWDLPQALQNLGGWPNELMVDYFVEYARILFDNFGDRVKWWITFNEPAAFVGWYATIGMAPSLNAPGVGDYLSTHTVIKAHARVWRLYDQQYRDRQNGSVGITLDIGGLEPASNSTEDREASDRARQFQMGIFAHPLFTAEGDYPAVVRQRVDANSEAEGRPRSRLPSFTREEVDYIRGSADFIGLNHYSTNYVTSGVDGTSPSKTRDSGVVTSRTEQSPSAFRSLLNWIANEYPGYPIFVTENGFSDRGLQGRNDTDRIEYYMGFLGALLEAVNTDRVPVIGYTAWSLMDNIEWSLGTWVKYGLYEVDFKSPDLTRIPKASAGFIAQVYRSKQLPQQYFQ